MPRPPADRGQFVGAQLDQIAVRRHGSDGPPVVGLHGGPGAPGSAGDLAAALGAWFVVLEPLQRRSGARRLTVARHVEDLAAVFPPGAMLVGWSWGAMLALSFAARHASAPRAIALVGTGTYDAASRDAYAASMQRRLGRAGRARMHELNEQLRESGDRAERDRLFEDMGVLASAAQSVDLLPGQPSQAGVDGHGNAETWHDALRLQRTGIEPEAFRKITVPVVMLHGDHDPHPGPLIRDRLRSVMPQLEYIEFAECGHEPWRERRTRELFLATLRDWLLVHSAEAGGGAVTRPSHSGATRP